MKANQTVSMSVRNVLKVYRSASPEQVKAGLSWYSDALALATELDPTDVRRGAAVIAVLSPLKSWEQNVRLARAAYAGEPVRTLGSHVAKVRALLDGADPDTVVSGLKVRAFWHSIYDPSNSESVAIDRHAVCIAAGRVLTDAQRAPYAFGKRYAAVRDLYVRAACIASREAGETILPLELQAATWLAWRESHAYERRAA